MGEAANSGGLSIFRQAHRSALRASAVFTAIVLTVGMVRAAWAQLPEIDLRIGEGAGDAASILQIMVLFTLISLAPSILVIVTPFTRIVVVLALLRNAMGTQQTPPNTVIIGLALFLSFFVMAPVLSQVNDEALGPYLRKEIPVGEAMARAESPVRGFMLKQTRVKDLALFVTLAKLKPTGVDEIPTYVIVPSFMISELKTAFQIGFVVYIPFLVVDMVIASILMSMGMLMVPPILISLPFKLLLFILADGWNLVFGSIVKSFH